MRNLCSQIYNQQLPDYQHAMATVADMSVCRNTGRGHPGGAAGRGNTAHHGARRGPGVLPAGGVR